MCKEHHKLILFDAVGTLIHPIPCVADVYHATAKQYGARLSREEIAEKFPRALARHFPSQPAMDQASSDAIEKCLWRRVVDDIFGEQSAKNPQLFDALWQHFSRAECWAVYSDMKPILEQLVRSKQPIGIASNFDSRLVSICSKHFPFITSDRIFYSTQLGYAKPDPRFFHAIEERLKPSYRQIVLVGDDHEKDLNGARSVGWLPIDRNDVSSLRGLFHF